MGRLSRRIAQTPLARPAAFPVRLRDVVRHDALTISRSVRWLVNSREHTNYTYDLTERNLEHMAWWLARISRTRVPEIRGYMRELAADPCLREHIQRAISESPRRRLADSEVRYGRRLGWYALTRAMKPDLVVETGTDKGLGSCVFAAALQRNGNGKLVTLDVNPDSGYLITGDYSSLVERQIGDSVELIENLAQPVDLFLHDSLHTVEHETRELQAVTPLLTSRAVVLSDNAHESDALLRWAESTGRVFDFFRETPHGHWWPGEGIGVATHEAHAQSPTIPSSPLA